MFDWSWCQFGLPNQGHMWLQSVLGLYFDGPRAYFADFGGSWHLSPDAVFPTII